MFEKSPNIPVDGHFDQELCKECGGDCCYGDGGFIYSAEDLGLDNEVKTVTEIIRKLDDSMYVELNHPQISSDPDWSVHDVYTVAIKPIDGRCAKLGDAGCTLSMIERPALCRRFTPHSGLYKGKKNAENPCDISFAERIKLYRSWMPYQEQLKAIYETQDNLALDPRLAASKELESELVDFFDDFAEWLKQNPIESNL